MALTDVPPVAAARPSVARSEGCAGLAQRDWAVLAGLLGLAALYYLVPSTILSIAGYLGFAILAWWRPDLALVLVVGALPFYYHPRAWGRLQFAPAEALLLAVSAAWLARDGPAVARWIGAGNWRKEGPAGLVQRVRCLIGPTFGGPFLFFGLAAVASLILPHLVDPKVALREFRTAIVEPMLFYLLILRWVRTRRQIGWLIDGLVVVAAVVGRFGLEQFLLNRGAWEMEGVRRVSAFYPSATALGLFLGRVLPIAGALAIFAPSGRRKVAYGILCLPIAAGVFLSWTRAAWLGVAAAFALIVLLAGGRRLVAGYLVAAGLAIVGLVVTRPERITELFSAGDGTHTSRIVIWQSAVNVLRERPFTGAGLDQFVHLDAERYGIPHVRFMLYSHPHDLILDFWIRLGLLGLIALIWLLVRFYGQTIRLIRRVGDPYLFAVGLGLLGSMTHFVVHGLFDLTYFQEDLAFVFWLTLGLVEVIRRIDQADRAADTS